jgi:hypothetical protein
MILPAQTLSFNSAGFKSSKATYDTNGTFCRTSDLIALANIMVPVITQSVRDAWAQIHTDHQSICTYLFGATVAGTATTTTPATATVTATSTARASASRPDNRQRSQPARTTIATLSTDIRRFFPGRNSAT